MRLTEKIGVVVRDYYDKQSSETMILPVFQHVDLILEEVADRVKAIENPYPIFLSRTDYVHEAWEACRQAVLKELEK